MSLDKTRLEHHYGPLLSQINLKKSYKLAQNIRELYSFYHKEALLTTKNNYITLQQLEVPFIPNIASRSELNQLHSTSKSTVITKFRSVLISPFKSKGYLGNRNITLASFIETLKLKKVHFELYGYYGINDTYYHISENHFNGKLKKNLQHEHIGEIASCMHAVAKLFKIYTTHQYKQTDGSTTTLQQARVPFSPYIKNFPSSFTHQDRNHITEQFRSILGYKFATNGNMSTIGVSLHDIADLLDDPSLSYHLFGFHRKNNSYYKKAEKYLKQNSAQPNQNVLNKMTIVLTNLDNLLDLYTNKKYEISKGKTITLQKLNIPLTCYRSTKQHLNFLPEVEQENILYLFDHSILKGFIPKGLLHQSNITLEDMLMLLKNKNYFYAVYGYYGPSDPIYKKITHYFDTLHPTSLDTNTITLLTVHAHNLINLFNNYSTKEYTTVQGNRTTLKKLQVPFIPCLDKNKILETLNDTERKLIIREYDNIMRTPFIAERPLGRLGLEIADVIKAIQNPKLCELYTTFNTPPIEKLMDKQQQKDYKERNKYIRTVWTLAEKKKLIQLFLEHKGRLKFNEETFCEQFGRSLFAIRRQLYKLGYYKHTLFKEDLQKELTTTTTSHKIIYWLPHIHDQDGEKIDSIASQLDQMDYKNIVPIYGHYSAVHKQYIHTIVPINYKGRSLLQYNTLEQSILTTLFYYLKNPTASQDRYINNKLIKEVVTEQPIDHKLLDLCPLTDPYRKNNNYVGLVLPVAKLTSHHDIETASLLFTNNNYPQEIYFFLHNSKDITYANTRKKFGIYKTS